MKTRKTLAVILAIAMILGAFCGCGSTANKPANNAANNTASTAVTVTDMTGREITLEKPAERIVALTASDCEILFAVGAGDKLVGRGTYCDYPAAVLEIPEVASGADTNIEQILALKPDVLLMSTMAQTEEQVKQLEAAGVKVVVSDAKDLAGTYQAIELIGKLMGADDKAAAVIKQMKDVFEAIGQKKGDFNKSIYFEISPLEWGLWTAGKNTFMDEIAHIVGLKNAFDDVEGFAGISEEQVISRNPDYILTITMYYGQGLEPIPEILQRKGWEEVSAVKNEAILNLVNNELSRPAPRLAEGAQALYDFVNGK